MSCMSFIFASLSCFQRKDVEWVNVVELLVSVVYHRLGVLPLVLHDELKLPSTRGLFIVKLGFFGVCLQSYIDRLVFLWHTLWILALEMHRLTRVQESTHAPHM